VANRIKNIMGKYFKYDDSKKILYFTGESLEVRVPKRFEIYGLIDISDTISTIGIMQMLFDGGVEEAALHLPAKFNTEPVEISQATVSGLDYVVFHYTTGSKFMANTQVVRNSAAIYAIYAEFITRGKPIHVMDYENNYRMFDNASVVCGTSIPANRAIFEVVAAHLTRDSSDAFVQYRHTDMTNPPHTIALRSVIFAPDSNTARFMGSYAADAIVSSLTTSATTVHPFEEILRGNDI
jgi:hypothetical protein